MKRLTATLREQQAEAAKLDAASEQRPASDGPPLGIDAAGAADRLGQGFAQPIGGELDLA